jgi:hypothetical protein
MATSKPIAPPIQPAAATPDHDVTASMSAHAATVRNSQSQERSARRAATAAGKPVVKASEPDARLAALIAWRATADAPAVVLEVVDLAIRRGTATPRTIVTKADPAAVAAFFQSTGLSVKQIAAAVGVSTSVISTVTRENGDRWSVARFDAARPLILAAAKKIAAKTK